MKIPYISTLNMSREEWLEKRKEGIGGSDAAAIMGASPWASPLSVYMDKVGIAPDKPETEAMRQGTDFEDVVAKRFTEDTGIKVQKCNKMFSHPEHAWMKANIDRQLVGWEGFCGLECKTTSVYNKTDFAGGAIPPTYYWQCMHYMAVTGAQQWYLAVMVLSQSFHVFRIERDDKAIETLIAREKEFWEGNVLARVTPYPIGTDADNEAISMITAGATEMTISIDDIAGDLDTLAFLEADLAEAQKKVDAAKQMIKMRMGSCTEGVTRNWRVTFREQTSNRIDSKRLAAELPDVYSRYTKQSVSRVLRIKREAI